MDGGIRTPRMYGKGIFKGEVFLDVGYVLTVFSQAQFLLRSLILREKNEFLIYLLVNVSL
jgi:hypothetical protein